MARYNGNNIFLSIDGTVISSNWKEIEFTPSMEAIDTTQGVARKHLQRSEGLNDTAMTIIVGYDKDNIQAQFALIKPGIHHIVFGPEGSATGQPRHEQSFIVTEAPFGQDVKKKEVAFTLSCEGADEPVVDMHNGGVFS